MRELVSGNPGPRDHFHLQPRKDLEGVTSQMASGEQVATYGRLVLQELAVPALHEGVCREEGRVLLAGRLPGHWTEHSERHFLPSYGAQVGISDPERDLVSRWNLGKLQSRDYVLSAGTVSRKVQEKVATSIKKCIILEDEFIQELQTKFAEESVQFIDDAINIYKEVVEFNVAVMEEQFEEQYAAKKAEGGEGPSGFVAQEGGLENLRAEAQPDRDVPDGVGDDDDSSDLYHEVRAEARAGAESSESKMEGAGITSPFNVDGSSTSSERAWTSWKEWLLPVFPLRAPKQRSGFRILPRGAAEHPKGPFRTKNTTAIAKIVNYYAVVFLLRPPNLVRRGPFLVRKNVCNSQETGVRTRRAAIVNHPAVLKYYA